MNRRAVLMFLLAAALFMQGCGAAGSPADAPASTASAVSASENADSAENVPESPAAPENAAESAVSAENTSESADAAETAPESTAAENTPAGNDPAAAGDTVIPDAEAAEASIETAEEMSSVNEVEAPDGLVFSSALMNFSFLYDPRHEAHSMETGAAQLAFNGDTSLCGLFVSVADAENLPEIEEMLEEDMFGETQKYMNAMVDQPRPAKMLAAGHRLRGYTYAYSARSGETVDGSYYIEKRDGKYIFYRTEVYRESADEYAAEDAIEKTAETIRFSADAYGKGNAVIPSEIGDDNTPENEEAPELMTEDIPDGAYVPDTEGDYTFLMDEDYLVIADGQTTMVYTGGGMQMPFFLVEEATDEVAAGTVGKQIVAEMNDVKSQLQNRMVDKPEVKLIRLEGRKIAGYLYSYSSVDGTRTIEAAQFYETIGSRVFRWYSLWNRGDDDTAEALEIAIDTFSLK